MEKTTPSANSPYRFFAYPSATEGNPLLGIRLENGILVPLPGSKHDPLVVEIHTHQDYYPHVQVYRNGLLIAHSEIRRRERDWE